MMCGDREEQAGILVCLMNVVPLVPLSSPLESVEDCYFNSVSIYIVII